MIRSLTSWNSPDPKGWTAEQRRYRKHLTKIERHLPPALQHFIRDFTLHDDHISSVQIVSGVPSGRDALVTVEVFRDGYVGTAALLVLHLIGIKSAVKKVAPDLDIMYFDIERSSSSLFKLSFAFEQKKTWTMKFSAFDFYYHDYRKGEPIQRATDNDRAAPRRV
jgi:hypothetical protein